MADTPRMDLDLDAIRRRNLAALSFATEQVGGREYAPETVVEHFDEDVPALIDALGRAFAVIRQNAITQSRQQPPAAIGQLPAAAGDGRHAQDLAARVGEENAAALIRTGWTALRGAVGNRPDLCHPGIGDFIVASVLAGVFADTAAPVMGRAVGEAGVLEGARAAIRDAELAAVADTIRTVYRMARAREHNPVHAIIDLADQLHVDLGGGGPATGPADDHEGDVDHLADVIAHARLTGVHAGGFSLARAILAAGYSRKAEA